ncbi:hypothetical protein WMY93_024190 [Mugilogobius chulae]|uniref:Uncharacterized protein n=1 Tax=Mugilogobius chulae TaxID=88201 RepID=A0AAW0N3U5_9GOBI
MAQLLCNKTDLFSVTHLTAVLCPTPYSCLICHTPYSCSPSHTYSCSPSHTSCSQTFNSCYLRHTPYSCSSVPDPEEFLTVLMHDILALDPLLKLASGGKVQDMFCYQIFLDPDHGLILPTVQQLLEHSFHSNKLKLSEVPSCLILQMPRFGKKFKMLTKSFQTLGAGRDGPSTARARPTALNVPEVSLAPELGGYLNMSVSELSNQTPRDMRGVAKRLLCDAYLYLYQSPALQLYT